MKCHWGFDHNSPQFWMTKLPSLTNSLPETNMAPVKLMVGRLLSYWVPVTFQWPTAVSFRERVVSGRLGLSPREIRFMTSPWPFCRFEKLQAKAQADAAGSTSPWIWIRFPDEVNGTVLGPHFLA